MRHQTKRFFFLLSLLFIFGVGVLSSNQEQPKPEPGTSQASQAPNAGAKIAVMAPPPGSQENPPGAHTPDQLLQAGHTGRIDALVFSPDRQWLASGGDDRSIILWNATTGEEVRKLKGHSAALTQLVFSPDGKRLLSADLKGGVKSWDCYAGKVAYSATLRGQIAILAYSADGQLWAATLAPRVEGPASRIEIHNAATGKLVRTIPTDWYYMTAMAIVPGGLLVSSGALSPDDLPDGSVHVWNLASAQLLKTYPGLATAFSPDGRWMALPDNISSKVILADLLAGQKKQTIMTGNSEHVSFSPDGRQLATTGGNDSELKLWSVDTGKEIETLPGDKSGDLSAVVFSPDGKAVAAAAYFGYTIKIWDVAAARERQVLRGQGPVLGIAVSPDGRWLAAASQQALWVWDLAAGKIIATPYSGPVSQVVFSRDGRWLAANAGLQFPGETLKVWDTKSWAPVAEFKFDQRGTPVASIVFPVSRLPLTSVGPFTRAWEFTAERQSHSVWSGMTPLAISPDGKFLVTQMVGTGKVELWDVASRQKLQTLPAHNLLATIVAFSPDGRWLLSGGLETQMPWPRPSGSGPHPTAEFAIKFWDVATWKVQKSFSFATSEAVAAAFSSNGQVLAVEKDTNRIDLLDADRGTTLATLIARDPQAQGRPHGLSLAFSPDGNLFFQAAHNGIRVWKLKPAEK